MKPMTGHRPQPVPGAATEVEWLACDDAVKLIATLEKCASDRKFMLFAIAGCYICKPRRKKPKEQFESVVRYADGATDIKPVRKYWGGAAGSAWPDRPFAWAHQFAIDSANGGGGYPAAADLTPLVRDIFGNPFSPPAFNPDWRTDTAVLLARQMYASRDFTAMPILADALQDAGCDNAHILDHCRGVTLTHVRGCWACDLVLGKS